MDPSPDAVAVAFSPARPSVVPYRIAILPKAVPIGHEDGAAVVC